MRTFPVVFWMLMSAAAPAGAQVNIDVWLPGASIGISVPAYPQLVLVPGYPVYYAPQLNSNYFFFDGMYWLYQRDSWYASSWYNGPWGLVAPEVVPLYLLRVPVRYYRQPPSYFRGWGRDAPPRWGEHWGNGWQQQHRDWDRWDRGSAPAPAPLPAYQRQYSGSRYPQPVQQQTLQTQNYRYQPHEAVAQQRPVPHDAAPPDTNPRVPPPANAVPAAAVAGTRSVTPTPPRSEPVPQAARKPPQDRGGSYGQQPAEAASANRNASVNARAPQTAPTTTVQREPQARPQAPPPNANNAAVRNQGNANPRQAAAAPPNPSAASEHQARPQAPANNAAARSQGNANPRPAAAPPSNATVQREQTPRSAPQGNAAAARPPAREARPEPAAQGPASQPRLAEGNGQDRSGPPGGERGR